MRDYEQNTKRLFEFSSSAPYRAVPFEYEGLYQSLSKKQKQLSFPAIHDDIGSFIKFMIPYWKPKTIFEMGSGYGQSAFWFLLGGENFIDEIILTEKRADIYELFKEITWPETWKEKMTYENQDAFSVLERLDSTKIDLALIDGVKSDYLEFLNVLETKISPNGIVLIDNSFWRGSFLDKDLVKNKKSALGIKELHEYIHDTKEWEAVFIPYIDGLSVLKKTKKT